MLESFIAYWSPERIDQLVEEIWTNQWNALAAKAVIMGESSYKPLVFNQYTAKTGKVYRVRGLLQISDIHKGALPSYPTTLDDQLVFEPHRNLAIAKELWIREDRKWSPTWSAATKLGIE